MNRWFDLSGLGIRSLVLGVTAVYCTAVSAAPLNVQIDEMLAGANGDSTIQFIEIRMEAAGENLWGPQGVETQGRVRLTFHDATGLQSGEFVFPGDPPSGALSVLIATQAFADLPGMPAPDFIIPDALIEVDGQVCFTANPANANAPEVHLCLSYGNFIAATGTDTGGHPAGAPTDIAPITDATSLQRFTNFGHFGPDGHFNADFAHAIPAPTNSAGLTGLMTVDPIVTQGENLFFRETFYGNGRSCFTCHRPVDQFGLSSNSVSLAPANDPLFVHEFDVNLTDLENACLLRSARVLNLENIDGFANPPVFRGSPHLMNIALTAPYGHSGEFADLRAFAAGAVAQHLPKTLNRNTDPNLGPLDFRVPTEDELIAMEAFMNSIQMPADGDFSLDRMIAAAIARGADADAIQRGRDLFAGTGKCFLCHSGPVLAESDASLGGGIQAFDTGTVHQAINQFDACLNNDPLPPEAGGNRLFDTPQLLGVSLTAPYFHDNSALSLADAVRFYNKPEFQASPSGQLIGGIILTNNDVNDITAFLTALVEPTPADCNGNSTDDLVDLSSATSIDCNGNFIPDECELAGNDCNANGVPDECDRRPVAVTAAEDLVSGDGAFFVTHADLDGDGDQDVIYPNWNGADCSVLLNDGAGQFTYLPEPYDVIAMPRYATMVDVDKDGDIDAVVPNLFGANVSLLLNNGTDGMGGWLGFAPAVDIPIGGNGALAIASADFNNDSWPDLAVSHSFTSTVRILLNNGESLGVWQGFAAFTSYALGGVGGRGVVVGRFNNDAFPDLAVALRTDNKVRVMLNNGSGVFTQSSLLAVEAAPESVASSDFNNDGFDDLAVGNTDADTVSVLLSNNGSGFLAQASFTVGNYPFGARPTTVVAADMNHDGASDIVMNNQETDNVSVLVNNGSGSFATLVNFPVPSGPDAVTCADFDGDGRIDVVTAHFQTDSGVLLRNATLAFGGDCDGNGLPDTCDIDAGSQTDFNGNDVPDSCEFLGDINHDMVINNNDLTDFVGVLIGTNLDAGHIMRSDINGDGIADGEDAQPFVALLLLN